MLADSDTTHGLTSDTHQPILADAVARQDLPMRFIVPKAAQAAQVLAPRRVPLGDDRLPRRAVLARLRPPQPLHHRLRVAAHQRRRARARAEVLRPVAPPDRLHLLALRVRLRGRAHLRRAVERRAVLRRHRLLHQRRRQHRGERAPHRREDVPRQARRGGVAVLLPGRVRRPGARHCALAGRDHSAEGGAPGALLVRVELERGAEATQHGLAQDLRARHAVELARDRGRRRGRRVEGGGLLEDLLLHEVRRAAHGRRRAALLGQRLAGALGGVAAERGATRHAEAIEVGRRGHMREVVLERRDRRRGGRRDREQVVVHVERGDGRYGGERAVAGHRRRRDVDEGRVDVHRVGRRGGRWNVLRLARSGASAKVYSTRRDRARARVAHWAETEQQLTLAATFGLCPVAIHSNGRAAR